MMQPTPESRRFSMIRSFHMADWMTVGNAVCCTGAVLSAMTFLLRPAETWHLLDCVFLLFLVACGASRLARYNVTAERLASDEGKVRYFEGTPIPTSLVMVAILAACLRTYRTRAYSRRAGWQGCALASRGLASRPR